MKTFAFQIDAEKELIAKIKTGLAKPKQKGKSFQIQFVAPTGAGKTKMVSTAIKKSYSNSVTNKEAVTFLWIAPRALHEQSFDRTKSMFKESKISCYLLDNGSDTYFKEDSVCFFNWESINKKENILSKDNEQESGLNQKIQKTKELGVKIVAIVDESHYSAKGEAAQEVMSRIDPDVLLEVTATPIKTAEHRVFVNKQDVIAEGLIRESIIVNPNITEYKVLFNFEVDSKKTNTTEDPVNVEASINKLEEISALNLIDKAIAWQQILKTQYSNEDNSPNITPLILVQFPDSSTYGPDVEKLKNEILNHLDTTYGWKSGAEIAQWFDKIKIGLDTTKQGKALIDFDSNVKILFFKQAISLGWDCPRAQILVEFREFRSDTFKTQVLGRILRQPEQRTYDNPILNKGYVFTNNKLITLKQDVVSLFDKEYAIKQNDTSSVGLPSSYNINLDERYFLRSEVTDLFYQYLCLKKDIFKIYIQTLETQIQNLEITDIDESESDFIFESVAGALVADSLSLVYDLWFKKQISSFASSYTGRKYLRAGWEKFFIEILVPLHKMSFSAMSDIHLKQVCRSTLLNNSAVVEIILRNVLDAYITEQEQPKKRQIGQTEFWVIPPIQTYSKESISVPNKFKKSMYDKVFGMNGIETKFAKFIDSHSNVDWWIKNRDSGKENFAIQYTDEHGKPSLFYVDFVVKFKNGQYGLFDPKGIGREGTATTVGTKLKANALFKYATSNHCLAGIIGEDNGVLKIIRTGPYVIDETLSKWEVLDTIKFIEEV